MGEDQISKKVEFEAILVDTPPSADEKVPKQDPSEKNLLPLSEAKVPHSKSSPIVKKVSDHAAEKKSEDTVDKDAILARIETEKRLALIKAWEESEKTKAENKAYKKISAVGAWEKSKEANIEAELKKIEEKFERIKAEEVEKMSNKKAEIRKAAEEKRATVEAKRGEDILKVEEMASKFHATGNIPKRFFGCFSC
ncbi:hypothetical protein U1Q18_019578 [Sarracenia purpurea var. burkii]